MKKCELCINFSKRVLDLMIGFICLIIMIPLLIPITLILKFSGEGDIFYLQSQYFVVEGKNFNLSLFLHLIVNNRSSFRLYYFLLKNDF